MSHLKERQQKNCLNCNAQVYGKYCHICGQENLEPAESVWHLITHFINDITHFDGKFFSTLRLLVFKPGFLPAEYKYGRRHNYLNPVRMYVFTSFFFFFVFFSLVHVDEDMFNSNRSNSMLQAIAGADSVERTNIYKQVDSMSTNSFKEVSRALNDGRSLTKAAFKQQVDSIRKNRVNYYVHKPKELVRRMDSARFSYLNNLLADMDSSNFSNFTKIINEGKPLTRPDFYNYIDNSRTSKIFGKEYKGRAEYDSLQNSSIDKDGWLKKKMMHKLFEVIEKIDKSDGKVMGSIFNIVLHYFPQMLFLSLPLFALVLKLLYFRHKDFYLVAHGIFTIHLYIFYFIGLMAMLLLNELSDYIGDGWSDTGIGAVIVLLSVYEYKAMRNYYGQGRAKTLLKFFLAGWARFTIILILFTFFLLFSFFKI